MSTNMAEDLQSFLFDFLALEEIPPDDQMNMCDILCLSVFFITLYMLIRAGNSVYTKCVSGRAMRNVVERARGVFEFGNILCQRVYDRGVVCTTQPDLGNSLYSRGIWYL